MDEILKLLEEKGVILSLKITADICPPMSDEQLKSAIKFTLREYVLEKKDIEISNAFSKYAFNLALENIINKLDIKQDKQEITIFDILKGDLKNGF